MSIHQLDWKRIDTLIQLALEEDLGDNGDITNLILRNHSIRSFRL